MARTWTRMVFAVFVWRDSSSVLTTRLAPTNSPQHGSKKAAWSCIHLADLYRCGPCTLVYAEVKTTRLRRTWTSDDRKRQNHSCVALLFSSPLIYGCALASEMLVRVRSKDENENKTQWRQVDVIGNNRVFVGVTAGLYAMLQRNTAVLWQRI